MLYLAELPANEWRSNVSWYRVYADALITNKGAV